ncbi:MAG TPA: hypothetical protein VK196_02740 [Magnetospirillum sp.]|nr:hypothetical protein [Magnetospirillum sp.]
MTVYRQHRDEVIEWLKGLDLDLFVTFNANRQTTLPKLKRDIAAWFGRIDRAALGRNWVKKTGQRALGVGFFEHFHSNLHCHVMMRMPQGGKALTKSDMMVTWRELCAPGQLHVERARSLGAVASYVTKGLASREAQDAFFLASEWHNR